MSVMLDTNIISDMMRNPTGAAFKSLQQAVAQTPDLQVCTSVVVDAELQFGLQLKQSVRLNSAYAHVMQVIDVLPLEANSASHYAALRATLTRAGTPIGPNDMLIAAHALALGCTLVTNNEEEFRRVPGLRVENWL
jgi:tRNA(fMet)-specific endonuclease VapC